MKKLSKKKRNELRIKEEIKEKQIKKRELHEQQVRLAAERKKNQPWVKKIRICRHYKGRGGGIVAGFAYTTLQEWYKDSCFCTVCHKRFPIGFMLEMEKLTKDYAFAGCCEVMNAGRRLIENSRPVLYYIDKDDQICYADDSQE